MRHYRNWGKTQKNKYRIALMECGLKAPPNTVLKSIKEVSGFLRTPQIFLLYANCGFQRQFHHFIKRCLTCF
jgi:tryptophan synthase alpha subunit